MIAASGGPDSMALIDMLVKLKDKYQFHIIAAHFDHQLRSDSVTEIKILEKYAKNKKIQLINGFWDKKDHPNSGVEAAARKARYHFLSEVVREYHGDYLLTAHHGDDLLENILLKLIRSGNPDEMNSLQAVGKMHGIILLRPLLAYSKKELLDYNLKNQISFVEDSTNFEDETMRNRLRHHVIPLLKKESPHLVDNALRFSEDEKVLSTLSRRTVEEIGHPERFLDFFYRLPIVELETLSSKEQKFYWQDFIWQKFSVRVGDDLSGFTLKKYQRYFYLWPNDLSSSENFFEISPDQEFVFQNRKFVLKTEKTNLSLVGDFWSRDNIFFAGNLPAGSRLLLKSGQHAKAKKMFAQSAIPNDLRQFCIAIFNSKKEAIFVEKTYQDQTFIDQAQHYFLYHLKNE